MKVEQRLNIDDRRVGASQSLGPFIAVTKVDRGEVHKGYLTTMHGQKMTIAGIVIETPPIAYGSTLRYIQKNDDDDDDPGIIVKLLVATCSNLKYDDRVPVNIDNIEYTVGVDCCIAMDENATCTKVLHKGRVRDLNGIVGMTGENLGVIHKVGFKTGNTKANHIGTLSDFKAKKKSPDAYDINEPDNFQNGLAWLPFKKHLLLVHCPSTSENDGSFMMPGDSGGLCYVETGDILKGVGICIGRLAAHFYLILPLALIEAVYKEKGYNVCWNENNDDGVYDDESPEVDDEP